MNYPAIKEGDKVSFDYQDKEYYLMNVKIEDDADVYFHLGYDDYRFVGYVDEVRLIGNGITNFRIHERADGTPVFMEGDEITLGDTSKKVMQVLGDSFLVKLNPNHESRIYYWGTFVEAHEDGWERMKHPAEETQEAWDEMMLNNEEAKELSNSTTHAKSDGLKGQEDTVEEEEGYDLPEVMMNAVAREVSALYRTPEEEEIEKALEASKMKGITRIDRDDKVYTKQEIVDVLNELRRMKDEDFTPDEAVGAHVTLMEFEDRLGITSEELE